MVHVDPEKQKHHNVKSNAIIVKHILVVLVLFTIKCLLSALKTLLMGGSISILT